MYTPPLLFALFFLIAPKKKKWFLPFILGMAILALSQLQWLARLERPEIPAQQWIRLLSTPASNITLGSLSVILILWSLIRFFNSSDPRIVLAKNLEKRRDWDGAAQIMFEIGQFRQALRLFHKSGDWKGAAEAALKLGKIRQAADYYRKSGRAELGTAVGLYQRSGNLEASHSCRVEYAQWLSSSGRLDEAIEVWVRASDYQRACRIANLALSKGRLQASRFSFIAAKKAATETRNHTLLAQLYELEGQWKDAGRSYDIAGNHQKAATAYARAGDYLRAADAEISNNRPDMGATYLLEKFRQIKSQSSLDRISRENAPPSADLKKLGEKLIPLLRDLGRTDDLIEILGESGRTNEAIQYLLDQGNRELAAELASQNGNWDVAAPIYEDLRRWGEAGEAYERAEQLEKAAHCAELAGEDENAYSLWKRLQRPVEAAHCLARSGSLEDGIKELHSAGLLSEACELLRKHPGPIPDISDVVLDMADYQNQLGHPELAIAILQRAVLGVALQEHRVQPAMVLARQLLEIGDMDKAIAQVERVLAFDYSNEPAQDLKRRILSAQTGPAATIPTGTQIEDIAVQPDNVERYEIQNELGSGGMGVVYLARDTRLDRDVAIKVLRTTSAEEAQRLKNEAMLAATLNHPGIVTIFDFEEGFDGYFIAMEYVPGRTLADLLKQEPQRTQTQLPSILLQIAEALTVAHEGMVIHRDLKPANVLLTSENRVKILDFGIAARLDAEGGTGGICGTPYYMAPEQIRGETPSPATDIYSLGATAYHLAVGRPPFSTGNVIQAHLEESPEDPCALNPGLSPDLAAIILRCLEKEVSMRFSSCLELAEALRPLVGRSS